MFQKNGEKMKVVIDPRKESWMPHSKADGVFIKRLITKKGSGLDTVTVLLVKIPKEKSVAEHIHETSEDILYVLSGKGKMWVEEAGEFELKKNVMVRVPRGRRHRIFDIEEDILIYDVFSPAIF